MALPAGSIDMAQPAGSNDMALPAGSFQGVGQGQGRLMCPVPPSAWGAGAPAGECETARDDLLGPPKKNTSMNI